MPKITADQEFDSVSSAWTETHSGVSLPPPSSFSGALHRFETNLDNALLTADEPELAGWFRV